ncbi:MAG: hypothetical protein JRJ56_00155 [Deltaproteobacteria bacterium]|jgi:Fe-S cluster assembly iron-binding protein IscA|nr:hypothetical protein [Deltaproteobacteria bacterium]
MAIDNEKRANDQNFAIGGMEYLVDKDFLAQAAPIKVDFKGYGFQITSNLRLDAGSACGGCGSSSACCS